MKKLIIICLIYANAYSQNINSLLNEAIENSDLNAVAQIFELNQFSEKEKYMYLDLANETYHRRHYYKMFKNVIQADENNNSEILTLLTAFSGFTCFISSMFTLHDYFNNNKYRYDIASPNLSGTIISLGSLASTILLAKKTAQIIDTNNAINKDKRKKSLEIKQLITLSLRNPNN